MKKIMCCHLHVLKELKQEAKMMTIFVIIVIFCFSKERQWGEKKGHQKKTRNPPTRALASQDK
jgi:hypothetical protein